MFRFFVWLVAGRLDDQNGPDQNALVIGAEVLTQYVDYTDRQTCVLFGDGAGAAVLGPVDGNRGILASKSSLTADTKSSFFRPAAARAERRQPKRSRPATISSR